MRASIKRRLEQIRDRVRIKLAAEAHKWWSDLAASRHLLAIPSNHLSLGNHWRRALLRGALSLPDPFYSRVFKRLDVQKAHLPLPTAAPRRHRVLLSIGTLGPGGAERQLTMTVQGLVGHGVADVRVLCANLGSDVNRFFLPSIEKSGVLVADLGEWSESQDRKSERLQQSLSELLPGCHHDVAAYIHSLRSDQPEIAHFWLDAVNIKGGIAAVLAGVPRVVLGLRSLPPIHFSLHLPYMRAAYKWLARQSNVRFVSNSHAGAQGYEAWLGLPKGSIRVVHNGFDWQDEHIAQWRLLVPAYRQRHNLSMEHLVLGTVIRLTEEKRPFFWLEIAARVRRQVPEARFLIVGDGPLRPALESRASAPDLQGSVIFSGYESNTLAAMAAMDMFLLTSRAEGLPNVLIEAQIAGVPVVTTNVGGAPETLEHSVTGWVLENDHPDAAAQTITRLLRDQVWCTRARANQQRFIRDTFGAERMVDETLAAYEFKLS